MRLSDFKFPLAEKLIAQVPSAERDQSKLLVLNRADGKIQDGSFRDILNFLQAGDALVVNETKVFPARLRGQKDRTDTGIEVFLLRELNHSLWEVLVKPARKVRIGNTICFGKDINCQVVDTTLEGGRVVRFVCDGDFHQVVADYGVTPLPPYIRRPSNAEDKERYQTVYARVPGAVAAPTAGLHFTQDLLNQIRARGVEIIPILLHVGLGTFRLVRTEELTKHQMESEYYEVSEAAAAAINRVIGQGGRIFAVGTTTTRALETVANFNDGVHAESGWTDIFIYPPYNFKVVDAMITNFHLPGSTLIMMVSAFADAQTMQRAYRHAIRKKYRFYSYGDAMLIL